MGKGLGAFLIGLLLASAVWYYTERILIPYQQGSRDSSLQGNFSDLYPRWLGARELLLHGSNPYSTDVTREIQQGYYGRPLDRRRAADPKDQQGFAYPLYVVFLLAPTIAFPFAKVQTAFGMSLLVLTLFSIWLWASALRLKFGASNALLFVALLLGSYPMVQALHLQQLSLLVAFVIAASMAALVNGNLILAGMLLALATIKPQLAVPLVACCAIWSLGNWRERYRFALSFCATMALLVIGAELLLPGWMEHFIGAVAAYREYAGTDSIADLLLSHRGGSAAATLLAIATVGVCWWFRKEPAGSVAFSAIIAGVLAVTLVIMPTIAPYNQVLLVPGLMLLLDQRGRIWALGRFARCMYRATFGLVAWPWVAALVLGLASTMVPAARVQTAWPVPLYTSIWIPVVVLICLSVLISALAKRAEPAAPIATIVAIEQLAAPQLRGPYVAPEVTDFRCQEW